jgi:hypothetical protein
MQMKDMPSVTIASSHASVAAAAARVSKPARRDGFGSAEENRLSETGWIPSNAEIADRYLPIGPPRRLPGHAEVHRDAERHSRVQLALWNVILVAVLMNRLPGVHAGEND